MPPVQEFFQQGDREKAAKLPVSALMDRAQKGGITRSQVPLGLSATVACAAASCPVMGVSRILSRSHPSRYLQALAPLPAASNAQLGARCRRFSCQGACVPSCQMPEKIAEPGTGASPLSGSRGCHCQLFQLVCLTELLVPAGWLLHNRGSPHVPMLCGCV